MRLNDVSHKESAVVDLELLYSPLHYLASLSEKTEVKREGICKRGRGREENVCLQCASSILRSLTDMASVRLPDLFLSSPSPLPRSL